MTAPSISRRSFLAGAAGAVCAARPSGAAPASAASARPEALVMDAMGELRPDYEDALVREMLASGMDAITVTLCDPKPAGAEALALATDALLLHDRFLAGKPQLFVK